MSGIGPAGPNPQLLIDAIRSLHDAPRYREPGPQLMHLDRIPQGQAYDPDSRQLLTTFNDDRGVLVSLQDATSSEGELNNVMLGGTSLPDAIPGSETNIGSERNRYAPDPPPNKGGGIAVHGDTVYVADTQGVYRYSLEEIRNAPKGETVQALGYQQTNDIGRASYITIHGDYAYVGQFAVEEGGTFDRKNDQGNPLYAHEPILTRYEIDDNGNLVNPSEPITAPYYAQGVVVTEHGMLFSTSIGSKSESPNSLVYLPFDDYAGFRPAAAPPTELESILHDLAVERPDFHEVATLDYYAEEISIVGDELWVTYESNAEEYFPKYVENQERKPTNTHIQRIPLADLDLRGTGVTAEQLAQGARN